MEKFKMLEKVGLGDRPPGKSEYWLKMERKEEFDRIREK